MYNREYTPDRISELKENEIFVFGSNLAGAHGGGAARFAYERFGAVWGEGVGLHGQTYAIPTMQGGVDTIKPYVDEFIPLMTNIYLVKRIFKASGYTPNRTLISKIFKDLTCLQRIAAYHIIELLTNYCANNQALLSSLKTVFIQSQEAREDIFKAD